VLLEWLALRDPAGRRDEATRLLLGTGFLGGFTTYSALALQTDGLLRDDRAGLALAYALGTVVVGLLASVAGILAARAAAR
jgi:CrcB protein